VGHHHDRADVTHRRWRHRAIVVTDGGAFRRRLARSTAAAVLTNGWSMVLVLVTLPVLVREMGRTDFGVWALLQAFSATNGWLSITVVGLGVASVRQVAGASAVPGDPRLRGAVGAALVAVAGPGVVLGAVMAVAGAPALDAVFDLDTPADVLRGATVAVGVTVALDHVVAAVAAVLEGVQRVATARGVDAVRKTAVAVATATAAVRYGDVRSVAVAAALATAFSVVVAVVTLVVVVRTRPAPPRRRHVVDIVRYAGTVSLLSATGVLHRTMDRIIAGVAFGPGAVALVEIANQVQAGATALLSATSYPVLSAAPWLDARRDPSAVRQLLERTSRYATVLTGPVVAIVAVAAGSLVVAWVGDDLGEPATDLVRVAVLYVATQAPLQAGSNLLQGMGRAGVVLRVSLAAVAVNLVASVALAEAVGLIGVFWGTLVSSIVMGWALGRALAELDDVGGWEPLRAAVVAAMPPTAAAALAAGAVVLSPLSGGAEAAGAVVTGTAAAAAAGLRWSLTGGERRELSALARLRQP
jgi:O-antigen/teichoic acid export membrane protein